MTPLKLQPLCALAMLALSGACAIAQTRMPTTATVASSAAKQAEATPLKPNPPAASTVTTLPEHQSNQHSDVFGANLFTGNFARQGATQFNPDYAVAVGDQIQVRLWGAFEFEQILTVDPKGNIFIPNAGPVAVQGVRNQDLQRVLDGAVAKAFRQNVSSYASLAAAQPVRIFVGGNVARPGLYAGTSMDSLLHYLDQAGGIDPERGSFLQIEVKRGLQLRTSVNLYDFLVQGRMPLVQLTDGDVIFVPPRQHSAKVSGLASNAKRFEFATTATPTVTDLAVLAKPRAEATHMRITRNTGAVRNVESYPLENALKVAVNNGDEVEFIADKKPGTITVRVEGEHSNPQEYVLPYGSRLNALLANIEPGPDADTSSIQLFRQSVKQRQKELLATSLRSLETTLLTARSGSSDEARLRKDEADLTLQWIERAKQVEPLGQVQIAQNANKGDLLLENGDILRIPRQDALVLVSGEVLFPNAVAYQAQLRLSDYIQRSGGYTQSADDSRVVIARRDGRFEQVDTDRWLSSGQVMPGDQVLVLPKVDEKNRQFWKDMTQIIYQIAVSAKVVFGL